MGNREFDLEIKIVEGDKVTLRIWSKKIVSLGIRDVKFFYTSKKYDEEKNLNYGLRTDKCGKTLDFSFEKDSSKYKAMTFIIKNNDTRLEYAVNISMPKGEVTYKEMK